MLKLHELTFHRWHKNSFQTALCFLEKQEKLLNRKNIKGNMHWARFELMTFMTTTWRDEY